MHRTAGIEMELATRADQRVLRWFGHVERMVDCRSQWGKGTRETEIRLDGWCECGLRQPRNDGGAMRERPERVESPGIYVIE